MDNRFMSDPKYRWYKFFVFLIVYSLFLIWVRSWMGIIVIPFVFDIYVTRYINWSWWEELKNNTLKSLISWIDAIVFALVAVYFVNLYLFQNYAIPSSSLEKSLLIGDHLYVSKVAYGPRKPMTPLTMPLTHNTFPVSGRKSFIEKPQWEYERIKGFGKVQLNDIVVFNFPTGDTVLSNPQYQNPDFYETAFILGRNKYYPVNMDSMNTLAQRHIFDVYYAAGRKIIDSKKSEFGQIMYRPVDRRDNYVKRCVGLPGQTLQIIDSEIYLDGVKNKQPDNMQKQYLVTLTHSIPESLRKEMCLSLEDLPQLRNKPGTIEFPMTKAALILLSARKDIASEIIESPYVNTESMSLLFPLNMYTNWTIDNYGPVWIPRKGDSIKISLDNLPLYERIIKVYEGNDLKVDTFGDITINGKPTDSYTFKMDYYWMMGDNRHNSADSRYWGFVPEDHIVGRPVFIWLSLDKDKRWGEKGKIRWNRLFRRVKQFN